MANILYPKYKEHILKGDIDMINDTIKIALLNTSYVYSATHEFYTSAVSNLVGVPQEFLNKTVTNGVFDADLIVFTALTGSTVGSFVLYKDTGDPATGNLIAFYDTVNGFPFTPSGADEYFNFDISAEKIFAIK